MRFIMTREEILARGQNDYKNNDPVEMDTLKKSIAVGTIVGIALYIVLFVIELILTNRIDRGLWALVIAPAGVRWTYREKKLGQKKMLISGIVCIFLAGIACVIHIINLPVGGL